MKAGSISLILALVGVVSAMTPPGLIPSNTENMTVFFNTSSLATNGIAIAQSGAKSTPTLALDKSLTGTTFMVLMVDPDAGNVGGNGSSAFLHWMQDGFTSSSKSVTVGNKTVFALENTANVVPIAAYLPPGPPTGQTHRYTQYLVDTTGVKGFTVSSSVANSTMTRVAFNMQDFVKQANLTIISANFWKTTGGT
ncbi:hypothetical protein BP5796_06315 [Coleophoma crateriformis]|uniref:PEBP-like protein n=1 Tax=Coleophoma crateriformis TaxID=565419 RepID=A0A3D8RWP0_9HELO|nr:hypothetical protein BP5796_06315 [Coleophoma crateriformis]